MKKVSTAILFLTIISMANFTPLFAGEKAPQKVLDLIDASLVKFETDPVIVNAVKTENARGKTLDQIKEMDRKWQATPGVDDFMKSLTDSECGKYIRTLQDSAPYYSEVFIMDNQGANVAMTDKTSDYWQGDEEKFTESYKGGVGGRHVSDVKFDDSSQDYLVQVSLPVMDEGKAIGAITFGINIDKL